MVARPRDELEVEPDRLGDETEQLVFRVAQEAVRNVLDHAQARRVAVSVRRAGDRVVLCVEDDGAGFDREEVEALRREGHLGLQLLRDRAADLGGELSIRSARGAGTTIRLDVVAR